MSVTYDVRDRVAVVTIDRPDKRNAMDVGVFDGLRETAGRAADDGDVRAVLVRGAGDTFSSGIDVNVLGEQLAAGGLDTDDVHRLQTSFTAFEDLDMPVVAGVDGACFGAGLQLALACHLRVVTPRAQLCVMEVRWGLVPDLGGTFRLPRLVGLGRATELVTTGRRVDADEAVTIGLAERSVDTLDGAFDLARDLAASPGATRRALRLLRDNLDRQRDDALAHEAEAQVACMDGPDFAEAVAARFEGREPTYVGR